MCEPTTIALAGLAISAVSSGVQYDQGRRSANIQADNTRADAERAQAAYQRQADQQAAATAGEMDAANRKALHDTALFDATAGEYGGGNTIDRARSIGGIQAGEQLATIASNSGTAQSEIGFRGLDLGAQANEKLASISRPSLFGTALQIGSSAASAYGQYEKGERAKEPPSLTTEERASWWKEKAEKERAEKARKDWAIKNPYTGW